jgi:hypothetical protein
LQEALRGSALRAVSAERALERSDEPEIRFAEALKVLQEIIISHARVAARWLTHRRRRITQENRPARMSAGTPAATRRASALAGGRRKRRDIAGGGAAGDENLPLGDRRLFCSCSPQREGCRLPADLKFCECQSMRAALTAGSRHLSSENRLLRGTNFRLQCLSQ